MCTGSNDRDDRSRDGCNPSNLVHGSHSPRAGLGEFEEPARVAFQQRANERRSARTIGACTARVDRTERRSPVPDSTPRTCTRTLPIYRPDRDARPATRRSTIRIASVIFFFLFSLSLLSLLSLFFFILVRCALRLLFLSFFRLSFFPIHDRPREAYGVEREREEKESDEQTSTRNVP